jgi:uncharacterized protein
MGSRLQVVDRVPVSLTNKRTDTEWPRSLTHPELVSLGWKPQSINEFIVKVHSRCNLSCDYCYVYELGDSSWMSQPASMTPEVAQAVAERIGEHAQRHGLTSVSIILHGGEPLLLGSRRLATLLQIFTDELEPVTTPVFGMQTNGLLLTDEVLQVLDRFDVEFGISLDGGGAANDRHRRRRNGAGTYDVVSKRIVAVQESEYAPLLRGLLAIVDLENDPIETYEDLRSFRPMQLNFLLPHGNWTTPPPGKDPESDATPYGDWFIALFDHWFNSERDEPKVGMFDEMIRMFYGEESRSELVGSCSIRLLTIETNGAYELVDTMKSAYDGAAATNMNVFLNGVDDLLVQPSVAARQLGATGLSAGCRACPVVETCGGGYFPHRYRAGTGFLNPSVYCTDLFKLVDHVGAVLANLPSGE